MTPPTAQDSPRASGGLVPGQPQAPAVETAQAGTEARHDVPNQSAAGVPQELVALQQAADAAHHKLQLLSDHHERHLQRQVWLAAAEVVQTAVARYARTKRLNRYEVEKRPRQVVRHPAPPLAFSDAEL